MLPFLHIGSFQVATYTVAYAVVIVVCGMYVFHRFFVEGKEPNGVLGGLAAGFASGAIGAWVVHLIPVVWYWMQSGEWQPPTGGAISVALYSRWRGSSPWHVLDRAAVVIPLGQAIIRVVVVDSI